MLSTKKILICADGTAMDETLISYISFALKSSPIEHVYVVNIVSSKDETINPELKIWDTAIVEGRKKELHSKIDGKIDLPDHAKIHILVKKGNPFKEILKILEKESIDLVISGNKSQSKGSGVFNLRLARRAPCSIVIVPEGHHPCLEKLLVPIDFSNNSRLALEHAMYLSRSNDYKVEIITQNVYTVPTGYHYSGKSYSEFAEVMKDNAQKEYLSWIKRIDTTGHKITSIFTLDKDEDFAKTIKKVATSRKASGLIIGAKGRTAAAGLFIGSTAEKLINEINYLPLTITRKKGTNATFLESLSEL